MTAQRLWLLPATAVPAVLLLVIAATAPSKAQQQATPIPMPSPGFVHVKVLEEPTVHAWQAGAWNVSVTNLESALAAAVPAARPAGPGFLDAGKRYRFSWSDKVAAVWTVSAVREDGWVVVSREGGEGAAPMWVNAAVAVSIEELR
jgi:hypothetical protein